MCCLAAATSTDRLNLTFLFENQDDVLDNTSPDKKKNSCSAEELDEDELNRMEDCKPVCVCLKPGLFVALAPLAAGVVVETRNDWLPRKKLSTTCFIRC